jgi:hypothetical protein
MAGFHIEVATHDWPCLVRSPVGCAIKQGSGGDNRSVPGTLLTEVLTKQP